jgi:hypothetical protein
MQKDDFAMMMTENIGNEGQGADFSPGPRTRAYTPAELAAVAMRQRPSAALVPEHPSRRIRRSTHRKGGKKWIIWSAGGVALLLVMGLFLWRGGADRRLGDELVPDLAKTLPGAGAPTDPESLRAGMPALYQQVRCSDNDGKIIRGDYLGFDDHVATIRDADGETVPDFGSSFPRETSWRSLKSRGTRLYAVVRIQDGGIGGELLQTRPEGRRPPIFAIFGFLIIIGGFVCVLCALLCGKAFGSIQKRLHRIVARIGMFCMGCLFMLLGGYMWWYHGLRCPPVDKVWVANGYNCDIAFYIEGEKIAKIPARKRLLIPVAFARDTLACAARRADNDLPQCAMSIGRPQNRLSVVNLGCNAYEVVSREYGPRPFMR